MKWCRYSHQDATSFGLIQDDTIVKVDGSRTLTAKIGQPVSLIAAVTDDQRSRPTPCPEYDVQTLVNHIVGWVRVFDAGAHGRSVGGDPAKYQVGSDPAGEFRAAADSIVDFPTPPGPAIMVTPSAPEVTETCSGTRPRCDAAHHNAG